MTTNFRCARALSLNHASFALATCNYRDRSALLALTLPVFFVSEIEIYLSDFLANGANVTPCVTDSFTMAGRTSFYFCVTAIYARSQPFSGYLLN